jgi:transcriptional regulator with XRE-family HTH domain
MSNTLQTLGQNLVRIRNEKGLSGKEFSDLLGISEAELTEIENGTMDVETGFIYKAADILQVGLDDLLGSDTSKNRTLEQIKNKLDTCSEKNLILIFEYMTNILKIQYLK